MHRSLAAIEYGYGYGYGHGTVIHNNAFSYVRTICVPHMSSNSSRSILERPCCLVQRCYILHRRLWYTKQLELGPWPRYAARAKMSTRSAHRNLATCSNQEGSRGKQSDWMCLFHLHRRHRLFSKTKDCTAGPQSQAIISQAAISISPTTVWHMGMLPARPWKEST